MGNRRERSELIERENRVLSKLVELCHAENIEIRVMSGSNTPAALESHKFVGITEIRPGTYIFNDKNTVCAEAAEYDDCAVTVLTTVVSRSVRGRAIVDAGSKTLASDQLLSGTKTGFGHVREYPSVAVCELSEEHGHLDLAQSSSIPALGERLRIIPNHVCTCVNLFERVYGVRGSQVAIEWQVGGRGKVG